MSWTQRALSLLCRQSQIDAAPLVDEIEEDDDFKSAFLDEDTGEIYEGRFESCALCFVLSGKRILLLRHGCSWHHGFRHGFGICVYADGNMYEGFWLLGREHGHGVLMSGKRQVRLHGILGLVYLRCPQTIYAGEWSEGLMNGHGSYHYPNGDKYCGFVAYFFSFSVW